MVQGLERVIGRVNPLLEDLPWDYRDSQVDAIAGILEGFKNGKNVMVLDAPTGSGKTLIGESVRRMLKVKGLYICNSLDLQDQFLKDYPYAGVLKGKSNYPTDTPETTADDCEGDNCKLCVNGIEGCYYQVAKVNANLSPVAVTNTAYWLATQCKFGQDRGLVIIDECDTLEGVMMNAISVEIRRDRVKTLPKITVANDWAPWISNVVLPTLITERNRTSSSDIKGRRRRRSINGLIDRFRLVATELENNPGSWIYTGSKDSYFVGFKPIRVDPSILNIWQNRRYLLMSATTISARGMMSDLGYEGSWGFVEMDSTFPVENRLIKYKPVWNGSKKEADVGRNSMLKEVVNIVQNTNQRVLIHTVSYHLSSLIHDHLVKSLRDSKDGRKVFTYGRSADRATAIENYKQTPGSVLVASSCDRGIDLPDDLCRVQIIVKIPFANLGDKQINARLYSSGGQTWYEVNTARVIVQMTGRGIRNERDWCETWILDQGMEKMMGKRLFPRWWEKALVKIS